MEQITQEIISKLLKFIENEQTFSLDFYISATTPLLQLEDLLDCWRLHLPHRPDVVKTLEKERDQLFHWAHIVNETHGNDWESKKAIAEAKGRTKGFAQRLAKKLENTLEIIRGELSSEEPAETEQKAKGRKIMITERTSKENWEAIRSEYDISKKDFGKKINFVSDSFKRKIIFRDIEHAFVLALQGFSKPALILAGGVIEELLRLYLEHKNIKPKCEKFFSYIDACKDNGLLKRGVSRLTDSVRDFRNLVHLANEKTKRYTLSKATAKGAVSSIFTIANDFQ